jgi:signal peptidase II
VWRRWLFLPIAALVFGADYLTKWLIRTNLPVGYQSPEVLHFRIINITNTGSAFGLFTNQSFILTIVAIVGIIIILTFYRRIGATSKLAGIAIGLILGGALGNLIDRIFRGRITDFIYFRFWGDFYWPAFNVADSSLSIGIIILIWFIITTMTKKDEQKA